MMMPLAQRVALVCWVGGAVFAGGPAFSQTALAPSFDAQLFRPSPHGDALFGVESAAIVPSLTVQAGLYFDYAYKPLQLYSQTTNQRLAGFLDHRLDAQVQASVSVFDRLSLAVSVPVSLFQSGSLAVVPGDASNTKLAPAAFGDVLLSPKIGVLDERRHYLSAALTAAISIPSGYKGGFNAERTITAAVELDLSRRIHLFRLSANAGFLWRQAAQLYDLQIGPELYYRAGVGFDLGVVTQKKAPVELVAEVFGRTSATNAFKSEAQSPLEWLAGVKYTPVRWCQLNVGGGRGIVPGYGAPAARVFLGVVFIPLAAEPPVPVSVADLKPAPASQPLQPIQPNAQTARPHSQPVASHKALIVDSDGDGITDSHDRCPNAPGPKENNGCPEADTDKDGIPDRLDRCPADPEDKDGFQDDDGCPDLDNDGDGIPDALDKCPDQPETINGVDDFDGCPDQGRSLVVVTETQIEIKDRVTFKTASAQLDARSSTVLDQVAAVIKNHVGMKRVRIEGHTDEVGSPEKNQRLAQARAESVRDYLVSKGIAAKRLVPVGYGDTRPLSTNKTLRGREQNRRVMFTILGDETLPSGTDIPLEGVIK